MGMNLPAHLVIVKGTRRYVGSEAQDASGYEEYERSTCLQVANGVLEFPMRPRPLARLPGHRMRALQQAACPELPRCWAQMVGRAGRPQFDTEGVAVIMTQQQVRYTLCFTQRSALRMPPTTRCPPRKRLGSPSPALPTAEHLGRLPGVQKTTHWSRLVAGAEVVESKLKEQLPEFLNAEIALRTITDVGRAVEWMKSTFFYVRVSPSGRVWMHVPAASEQRCSCSG